MITLPQPYYRACLYTPLKNITTHLIYWLAINDYIITQILSAFIADRQLRYTQLTEYCASWYGFQPRDMRPLISARCRERHAAWAYAADWQLSSIFQLIDYFSLSRHIDSHIRHNSHRHRLNCQLNTDRDNISLAITHIEAAAAAKQAKLSSASSYSWSSG